MRAVDDELILVFVLDQPGANELLRHVGGQVSGLNVFLQLHDLLLECMDLGVFGVFSGLSFIGSLLVGLDLGLSPPSLAGGLQHVG